MDRHSRGRTDHRYRPPQPHAAGARCRLTLVPGDEAEGYRVQRAVHDLLLPQTGALVGYKIGCTSAVMQQYLDIPHPCGGGVFAKGVHDSGAKLRLGDYVRVGVECEIAVRLARNLSPGEAPFTAEWVMEAIEAYHPAIEIVDDRYVKWETMGAPTLVADDFFAAGCVLGKAVARIDGARSAHGRRPRRRSTARKPGAAPAPTCSAIPTTRWPGSPIISPPRARDCMPGRSC